MSADFRINTVHPNEPGGGPISVIMPHQVYLRAYKEDRVQYENLRAAKHILENVRAIFTGVRVFNQGGWCYTGRPIEWCIREDVTAPFPEHLVYAVYINPRYYLYEWRAEKADPNDESCPYDWRRRYEALIWKSTS